MGSENGSTDAVLQKIFDDRGFDIRDFKISCIQCRISRRMAVLEIPSLTEYAKYLESNPDEYTALFNTILMNVSQFFRDPDAWDFVKVAILPKILESDGEEKEIRIWSAGCASGEEPYSLAITLAEMLKDDPSGRRIKIHATDIDESSLKIARNGTYALDQLAGLPEDMRKRYFVRRGNLYTISSDIRRSLTFSKHNLVSDPPFSRINLLLCRNVLSYFNRALQLKIALNLQYALSDGGYLWLGRGETLSDDLRGIKPVDTKWRVFKKTQPSTVRRDSQRTKSYKYAEDNRQFKQAVQNTRIGVIMMDREYKVVKCNQAAQDLWFNWRADSRIDGQKESLSTEQILGRPFFDLEISYQPVDLRSRIRQAVAEREPIVVEGAEYWVTKDKRIYLRIEIVPVGADGLSDPGVIILLEDITERYELQQEMRATIEALETVNERFMSINEELGAANRELEVTNKEIQSTNEELESINEELKAVNEELMARIKDLTKGGR